MHRLGLTLGVATLMASLGAVVNSAVTQLDLVAQDVLLTQLRSPVVGAHFACLVLLSDHLILEELLNVVEEAVT